MSAAQEVDFPTAYEVASFLAWVHNPALVAHCARKAQRPEWDAERYAEFLARRWVLDAARGYLGRRVPEVELRKLVNGATRREAGREFVRNVVSGEWTEGES